MCRFIKDILFLTNLLGKKRKVVAFDLDSVPVVMNFRTVNIVWSGDRLIVDSTKVETLRVDMDITRTVTNVKNTYENGNVSAETISYELRRAPFGSTWTESPIFFNCTNVTYLEVNGTRLI